MNNEQLSTAQMSELGVDLSQVVDENGGLMRQVLSEAGLADDVGLLTGSIGKLKILLHLTKLYCDKFQVKLVWSKTKLLCGFNKLSLFTDNSLLNYVDM